MKKLFFIFSIVFCFSLIGAPRFDITKIVDNFRLDTWMTAIPSKKNISLWDGLEEYSSRTLPFPSSLLPFPYNENSLYENSSYLMHLEVEKEYDHTNERYTIIHKICVSPLNPKNFFGGKFKANGNRYPLISPELHKTNDFINALYGSLRENYQNNNRNKSDLELTKKFTGWPNRTDIRYFTFGIDPKTGREYASASRIPPDEQ